MELLRKPVSGVMLTLLLIGMLALSFNIQPVKASGTVYIRADGSIDPPDAPILTVDNVTYTLTGNITSDGDGIVVERDNIVVDGAGYALQGTGSGTGIVLSGRSNVTIKNTQITTFDFGIYFSYSSNSSIVGNNITANNQTGIHLDSSSTNSISGNNITNNDDGISLYYSSNNNSISGNNVTANSGVGIGLSESSDNNSISGNNLRNNYIGIDLYSSSNNTLSGNNITNNSYEGIGLFGFSDNNSISGNNITNNVSGNYMGSGIELGSSNDNIISGNNIANNNYFGISLRSSSNNSMVGNNIITNKNYGIYLYSSLNNIMVGNNITDHKYGGIWLTDFANDNIISGNNIANNRDGVCLYEASKYNNIIGNTITANNEYGIYFSYASSNNSIVGNSITNNEYGIWLVSSNNTFYHNNFVDNTHQVSNIPSMNVWDDGCPSGGNYWSNYTGVDADADGIGDTPYTIIDVNNIDRYPLIAPITVFDAGAWNGVACSVDIISNSTLSGFKLDVAQKTVSFNVTGVEGMAGFCRITIPNIIVQNLWQGNYTVLLNGEPWFFRNWTDATNTYIYINYTHTQHQITIIPEFPSALTPPLFMLATLVTTVLLKKKRKTKPQLP